MAKISAPKKHEVPTTNFILDLNKIDIVELQANYQLFTIEVPDSFYHFAKNSKINAYALMHNTYKDQFKLPYYYFAPENVKPFIYILAKKEIQNLPKLNFEFLKCEVIAQKKDIAEVCTDDNLHILAKLFLADYFYNHKKTYRICQGNFYIHSTAPKNRATVLKIEISKIKGSGEFNMKQKATYLQKVEKKFVNPQYIGLDTYCELGQGEKYYRQLKTKYVKEWQADINDTKELWKVVSGSQIDRPSIKWYETKNFKTCRSELLREFQHKLVAYYNETLGKDCSKKQSHKMTEVKPMTQFAINGYGENTGLYLKLLGKIGIYDNRFKEFGQKNQNSFADYIKFFNYHYGKKYEISFVEITENELNSTKNPVLVLQDVEKELFVDDGFLSNYDDPKKILYQNFASKVAMQTININTNSAKEHSIETYFNYDLLGNCLEHLGNSFLKIEEELKKEKQNIAEIYKIEKAKYGKDNFSDESKERRKNNEALKKYFSLITNKIDVCLNELLLKHYLINQLPIKNTSNANHSLPCIFKIPNLVNYAYMYQNTFMYVDANFVLQFLNLENPSEKQKRNDFLNDFGINWFEIETQFAIRNYTKNSEDKTLSKLKSTHFIFAKNLVLAIEDTEERVFFKTEATEKSESQRINDSKTALEGIYFSEEKQIYTVGTKSMDMTMDKSIKVRKLHYYQKPDDFKIDDLLQTLSVQFVRNQQYTVYPYFFDLLNLYRKDILRSE